MKQQVEVRNEAAQRIASPEVLELSSWQNR